MTTQSPDFPPVGGTPENLAGVSSDQLIAHVAGRLSEIGAEVGSGGGWPEGYKTGVAEILGALLNPAAANGAGERYDDGFLGELRRRIVLAMQDQGDSGGQNG